MFEKLLPDNDTIIYHPPKNNFKGIISIPHSGEFIPEDIAPYLTKEQTLLNKDVDTAVETLIDIEELTKNGIAIVISKMHRTTIDINRTREKTLLCWKQNSRGEQLVIKEPIKEEAERLISKYYDPYFNMIKEMVNELSKLVTPAPFVDLHSMPSVPTAYHLKQNPNQSKTRADFCISDLKGISCPPNFINNISESLLKDNYTTALNDPYFGGYVTQYINELDSKNIQIEINRRIYLDEESRIVDDKRREKLKPILTNGLIHLF